jgi:hypothetical protein
MLEAAFFSDSRSAAAASKFYQILAGQLAPGPMRECTLHITL